jgi:predicted DNA-binding protein
MSNVTLERDTYEMYADLANRTGKTVSAVANEALEYWMENNGVPILKALARRRANAGKKAFGRVLPFRNDGRIRKTN